MESFKSFEHKFQYKIIGHSGDGPNIEFVKEGKYPRTEKESLKIINQMYIHSQFCLSGGKFIINFFTYSMYTRILNFFFGR